MPVRVAEDPLYSVVTGAGKCVENIGMLQQILAPEKR
jgi:actin-like ATPase involved in cell morphogenesis